MVSSRQSNRSTGVFTRLRDPVYEKAKQAADSCGISISSWIRVLVALELGLIGKPNVKEPEAVEKSNQTPQVNPPEVQKLIDEMTSNYIT